MSRAAPAAQHGSGLAAAAQDTPRFVLLTPIEPDVTGNGLAMRAELFRRAAPAGHAVETVVVPVAGRLVRQFVGPGAAGPAGAASRASIVVAPDSGATRAGVMSLAADAAWAERLAHAGPLPRPARAASPGLVEQVVGAVGEGGAVALHVVRAYMAPLGAAVRERLGARWATLDLDEDDATFARSLGDAELAAGWDRLLGVFGPLFDGLSAASASEAALIRERHGLAVEALPNAVWVPPAVAGPFRTRSAGEAASLLYVGNLTYPPNAEAASLLAGAILPAAAQRLQGRVRLVLAGPHEGRLDHLRGRDVEVTGFVDDLAPLYASATAVVVPLRAGGGTRIKLLEAFAHEVPVVASSVAAAGLEVVDGRHLLLADDPERVVDAIAAIVRSDGLAGRLAAAAARLVRERYSYDAVVPLIRGFYARAARQGGDPA